MKQYETHCGQLEIIRDEIACGRKENIAVTGISASSAFHKVVQNQKAHPCFARAIDPKWPGSLIELRTTHLRGVFGMSVPRLGKWSFALG